MDSMGWYMSNGLAINNEDAAADTMMSNDTNEPFSWFADPFSIFTNLDSDTPLAPAVTLGDQSSRALHYIQHKGQLSGSELTPSSVGDGLQDASSMRMEGYRLGDSAIGSDLDRKQTIQPDSTGPFNPTASSKSIQRMAIISETGALNGSNPRHRRRRTLKRSGPSMSSDDENDPGLRAKMMHTAVERRYRDNLNRKFEQLSRTLKATGSSSLPLLEDANRKTRKVDVLTDAVGYINRSEVEIRHMADEIRRLNLRLHQSQSPGAYEDTMCMRPTAHPRFRRLD
ncbi:hypothetical protein A1O1_08054 [Capronia coronata CBS 617.96]|uniref:BHLH domain-containing protein n=1 Tax=Capronia coronata CBS 617.96 TaxID=1182541 RepID=W9XYG5_9EURO|nr:uncharacterized protein A1O1_08054 [Capronia coronata CBS 617.96]EXJ81986.1 hypothetical protein A1O1_08054 [Capronia coronata CBS 617.96]